MAGYVNLKDSLFLWLQNLLDYVEIMGQSFYLGISCFISIFILSLLYIIASIMIETRQAVKKNVTALYFLASSCNLNQIEKPWRWEVQFMPSGNISSSLLLMPVEVTWRKRNKVIRHFFIDNLKSIQQHFEGRGKVGYPPWS